MVLPPKDTGKRGVYKRNKLVYGVGINDADYNVYEYGYVNGKRSLVWSCPFYETWKSMLRRCYSEKFQIRNPTYKGCSVFDDWLIFSNFKRWMEQQDWQGKQLDKDLLVEGNKVYSPETCVFIDQMVNKFTNANGNYRGDWMIGVSWSKDVGKFRARCCNPFNGKEEHLGLFTNELDAHLAWKVRKHELACLLADSEHVTDDLVANALRTRYL